MSDIKITRNIKVIWIGIEKLNKQNLCHKYVQNTKSNGKSNCRICCRYHKNVSILQKKDSNVF